MPEWMKKLLDKLKGKDFDKLTDEEKNSIQSEIETEFAQKDKSKDKPEKGDDGTTKILLGEMQALKLAMAEEKALREKTQKEYAAQLKKEKDIKIAAKIDEAVKAGKIPAANEDEKKSWANRLEKDFDDAVSLLGKIPAVTGDGKSTDDKGQGKSQSQSTGAPTTRVDLVNAAKEAFKA